MTVWRIELIRMHGNIVQRSRCICRASNYSAAVFQVREMIDEGRWKVSGSIAYDSFADALGEFADSAEGVRKKKQSLDRLRAKTRKKAGR